MSSSPWIAALIALFVWWFSTGAILMAVKAADRRGPAAHRRATILGLPMLGFGVWGFLASLDGAGVGEAYLAFLSAIAIWGWIELAFLSGQITGPNRRACPPGAPEWERFIRAWGVIAYHEMLLTAALLAMVWAAWDAVNIFGLWTFVVLYFARISAKLNLFFGVSQINVEFLPSTLTHLPSHFRRAQMNWVFPLSVTALTFAAACWVERAYAAETAAQAAGFGLLSALTGLALLEHWMMMSRLPDEKLWRWLLPASPAKTERLAKGESHGL